jgi:hypothetical protein
MIKKLLVSAILVSLLAPALLAAELNPADQAYVNQLTYRHNKLELTTKTRTVNVSSSYSSTDINATNYRFDQNYRESNANITTSTQNSSGQVELTEWYIYKGGVDQLSDLQFLRLIGDQAMFNSVDNKVDAQRTWLKTGYITTGIGLVAMIGGAALSAGQPVILGGALVTTAGFFISAFSARPAHYIQSSYALNKIDEYNIKLKQQLGLPLSFE